MFALLLLAALGGTPLEPVVQEKADRIILQHFYDDTGRLVFDQWIFTDWDPYAGRFQVFAWRLRKGGENAVYDPVKRRYVLTWPDGETLRRIESHSFREMWNQYDLELAERDYLPKEVRRDLLQPRRGKKE